MEESFCYLLTPKYELYTSLNYKIHLAELVFIVHIYLWLFGTVLSVKSAKNAGQKKQRRGNDLIDGQASVWNGFQSP